jgi:hypothetical protein
MTPAEAKALANDRRAELRWRARRIRRSVVAIAAVLFTTLFLVVYVQLASGHDPALSASSKARSTSSVHRASSTSGSAEALESEESSVVRTSQS